MEREDEVIDLGTASAETKGPGGPVDDLALFLSPAMQVLYRGRPLTAEEGAAFLDAYPNRTALFDLKQDEGGMIDIEFIVQYLVLRHAASYPQLTANAGNIALLRLCGELGLIDAELGTQVADAYRAMRRLQHQVRL